MKGVDPDEPTSFLDYVYLGCTQRECEPNDGIGGTVQRHVPVTSFCWSNLGITRLGQESRKNSKRGLTTWRDTPKSAWRDSANRQTTGQISEDSKSTSAGILSMLGSRTYVPISSMCKKQTSVSHSSTETEISSLDAGLQMDG